MKHEISMREMMTLTSHIEAMRSRWKYAAEGKAPWMSATEARAMVDAVESLGADDFVQTIERVLYLRLASVLPLAAHNGDASAYLDGAIECAALAYARVIGDKIFDRGETDASAVIVDGVTS